MTAEQRPPSTKFSLRTHPGPVGFVAAFCFMCSGIGAMRADWLLIISNLLALPFLVAEFHRRRDAMAQSTETDPVAE